MGAMRGNQSVLRRQRLLNMYSADRILRMAPRPPSSTVIAAYDEEARAWDAGAGFRSPQFAARLRHLIVELLAPAAGRDLALELGVGTGWMLDATAPLFRRVHAID